MDINHYLSQGINEPEKLSSFDPSVVQAILIDTVLVPSIASHTLRFGHLLPPLVRSDASLLFYQAISQSDLPKKLGTTLNRTLKLLNFEHCYHEALLICLHEALFKHFQQAIRLEPELIQNPTEESQARTHLLLVSTRWYVNVIGERMFVIDCLREVHQVFQEAKQEYIARQTSH